MIDEVLGGRDFYFRLKMKLSHIFFKEKLDMGYTLFELMFLGDFYEILFWFFEVLDV